MQEEFLRLQAEEPTPAWSAKAAAADHQLHTTILQACGHERLAGELRRYNILVKTAYEVVGARFRTSNWRLASTCRSSAPAQQRRHRLRRGHVESYSQHGRVSRSRDVSRTQWRLFCASPDCRDGQQWLAGSAVGAVKMRVVARSLRQNAFTLPTCRRPCSCSLAQCGGKRAQLLLNEGASFDLALR